MSRAASGIIGCGLVLVLGVCGCSQQGANSSAPSAATTESAVRFQPNNLKSVRFTDRRADEPLTDPGATVFVAAFPNDCPDQGRLQHELLRQALLVAARDHMGLATCDDSLHDVRGAKDRPARLGILYNTRPKTMFVSVFRETQAEPDIVWEGGQTQASEMSLEDVVTHAEKMSRGELVQALEKAGYQAQSAGRPPQSTATVPESVARLL
ncbi:MAG: hypothetical protein JSS02_06000, partial [Planctomycetes bacterium]|nr:hypothetical protein [Planctomycetota bacterium]